MNFGGADGEYFYSRYLTWTPTDNFILEAWARPTRVKSGTRVIVYNGRRRKTVTGCLSGTVRGSSC